MRIILCWLGLHAWRAFRSAPMKYLEELRICDCCGEVTDITQLNQLEQHLNEMVRWRPYL